MSKTPRAVLGRLHQCGGEIGSIAIIKMWSDRCANDLNRKKFLNANENDAYEDYALAA